MSILSLLQKDERNKSAWLASISGPIRRQNSWMLEVCKVCSILLKKCFSGVQCNNWKTRPLIESWQTWYYAVPNASLAASTVWQVDEFLHFFDIRILFFQISLGHELNQPGRKNHLQKLMVLAGQELQKHTQKRTGQDMTWQDRTYHQATWHSIPSLFSTIRCLPQPTQPYAQTFAGFNDNETTFNPIKRIENKIFLLATLSCRQPAQNSLKICFQHWSTMKRDEWGAQQNPLSNMQIYENICTWIPLILSTPPRFGFICGRLPRPRCASTSGKGQSGGNVGILGDLNLVASKRAVACLLPHILFATVCRSKSAPTLETRPKPDQIDRLTDW